MKKIEPFYLEESPIQTGKYTVRVKHDEFFCGRTEGSFNILAARLLGLSYAWYLRMCRDELGAEIVGKDSMYPVAYFSNKVLANQLVKLLNTAASQVAWERAHPNEWEMVGTMIRQERKRQRLEGKIWH